MNMRATMIMVCKAERKTCGRRIKKSPWLTAAIASINAASGADITKARLFFKDGQVVSYADDEAAVQACRGLPSGCRVAFRGKGDATPVQLWECAWTPVDKRAFNRCRERRRKAAH
jgi:hypothetical protein